MLENIGFGSPLDKASFLNTTVTNKCLQGAGRPYAKNSGDRDRVFASHLVLLDLYLYSMLAVYQDLPKIQRWING